MDERDQKECVDEGRREALRKSAYAVYATPVITAMLVERASGANSWNPSKLESSHSHRRRSHKKGHHH